jgi:hypothetical protein
MEVEHNRFLDALISCGRSGGQIVEDFRIFPSCVHEDEHHK